MKWATFKNKMRRLKLKGRKPKRLLPKLSFTDLPAEIRLMIYDHVFADLDSTGAYVLSGYNNEIPTQLIAHAWADCIIDSRWPGHEEHNHSHGTPCYFEDVPGVEAFIGTPPRSDLLHLALTCRTLCSDIIPIIYPRTKLILYGSVLHEDGPSALRLLRAYLENVPIENARLFRSLHIEHDFRHDYERVLPSVADVSDLRDFIHARLPGLTHLALSLRLSAFVENAVNEYAWPDPRAMRLDDHNARLLGPLEKLNPAVELSFHHCFEDVRVHTRDWTVLPDEKDPEYDYQMQVDVPTTHFTARREARAVVTRDMESRGDAELVMEETLELRS